MAQSYCCQIEILLSQKQKKKYHGSSGGNEQIQQKGKIADMSGRIALKEIQNRIAQQQQRALFQN
jgi:hypothetical protein